MTGFVSERHKRLAPRPSLQSSPRASGRSAALGGTLAGMLLTAGAAAHHAGLYDESSVIDVEGEIVAVTWRNPHVRVALDVATDDGRTSRWELEGTSVNALERWGVTAADLPVGARMLARGPQSRFGRDTMIAALVRIEGGEPVYLWPNVASRLAIADTGIDGLFPPPNIALTQRPQPTGLFRVWTPRGRPPRDQSLLPLTESARLDAARYDALADDPALRCVPAGMPSMLDTPYPIEFVDGGDRIVMRFEEWDGVRTIYMNPRQGPPVQDPSPYGVSFGRWERGGETLAVFTLYIDYPYFDDLGTPQSGAVSVLERYTPSPDGARLDWEITVTDAATFTEPIVRGGDMAWEPGEVIKAFNCALPETPTP